jgi:hypothetical protein
VVSAVSLVSSRRLWLQSVQVDLGSPSAAHVGQSGEPRAQQAISDIRGPWQTPSGRPFSEDARHDDWPGLLRELGRQLDRGLVYDRDMPGVASALDEALAAFRRRIRPR